MMTQSHPTPEALSDFVQGRLEEVELEQVSAHLDACSACQRTLDQLSRANDTLIGKVREAGAAIESAPGEASAKGPVAPTRPKPPVAPREPAATPGLVIKPVNWEQVQQLLTDLELVSTDDVAALRQQLLAASSKELGADALRELTDQGKLTKYQAQAIFQGKAHLLSYGEYTVLDRLGAGGMGQVFKAVHRRMRRIVALKVLSSSALKNPEAVRRFEREATAAAKLSHPAIVSAYDLNTHGKTSFLVMEYIEGHDLSKIVDSKGPLPVNTAIDYILQAAEALAFAHSHGIIHRDIKPANLLIDRDGRLKVLDLGLAKFEGAGGESARTQLTVTAQVMGTVDYMAPEQALNTKKAEARSDIYSLGCTLYRLLTNQSVYDGETITERFLNHREAPIPSLRALRPDVPESLDELFRYMVGKKPEDRPATMAEVVRALKHIMASPLTSISAMLPRHAVLASDDTIRKQSNRNQASFSATVVADVPLVVSAGKTAGKRNAQPSHSRGRLFTAIGAAAFFVLLGLWVIVRDSDGNKVAEVRVPDGGSVNVKAEAAKPTLAVTSANPTSPTAPVVVPNSPPTIPGVSPIPSSQGAAPSNTTTKQASIGTSGETSSMGTPPTASPMTTMPPTISVPQPIKSNVLLPDLEVDADGFTKLFNGRDLTGWIQSNATDSTDWTVNDNALIGITAKSKTWLISDRAYEDFELRLEYQLAKAARAGVCFGAGFDDDLMDKEINEVPLMDESKAEFTALPESTKTGSIYRKLSRTKTPVAPTEKWNRLHLTVKGRRVTVAINDLQVLDDELSGVKNRTGRIGLQLYPSSNAKFRNLQLKGKWIAPSELSNFAKKSSPASQSSSVTKTLLEMPRKSHAAIDEWVNMLDWSTGYDWARRGIDWNANLESPITPQSLTLKQHQFSRIPLPVVIEGDYDMEIEFTRLEGKGSVSVVFPAGHRNLHLELGAQDGQLGGINFIDDMHSIDASENITTRRPWPIANEVRHKVSIRVRQESEQSIVSIDWDNERDKIEWRGPYKSQTYRFDRNWNFTLTRRPWLGSLDNRITFHTARVRMVAGVIRRDYVSDSDQEMDRKQGFVRVTELQAISPIVGYGSFTINQLPFSDGEIIAEQQWPFVKLNPAICADYYAAHAPSRLRVPIPKQAARFAVTGYNHLSRTVEYLVYVDGNLVKRSGVTGFCSFDLPIHQKDSVLELVVDEAGDATADHSYWCNPRFISDSNTLLPFAVSESEVGWGWFAHNQPIAFGCSPPIEPIDVVPCDEFIFAHAKSSVSYEVPQGMRRFTAIGYCNSSSSVSFSVWADATKLLESDGASFLSIDVRLPESTKTIELKSDPVGDNRCDHSMWCYPRLHRE